MCIRLEAIYKELRRSMTETQCIHVMTTRAMNPDDINAVREFCAWKAQSKDAK